MVYTSSVIDNLAIFGGKPTFSEKLHVGRPNEVNRQKLFERLNLMLDRNQLTNRGPMVRELEKKIADMVGVKHCIAMCNGTVALEIAIRALDLSGEVILPSLTFIATAHALQWQQITPVFADIDPHTYTLDPKQVEKMITPKTSGIIGVHLWGRPCDIHGLEKIAKKYSLKLLFDAAHAFGCTYGKKSIGGFGEIEVYSFHATKFFNTFEGGAVLTNNDDLAKKVRLMQNFGFGGLDKVIYIGTNGKMNEASAAMGLTSLENLDNILIKNKSNYFQYKQELENIPGIKLLEYPDYGKSNYQYVVLAINESESGLSRDEIMSILHHENVIARRYFYPGCHRMEPYRSFFPNAGLMLKETEKATERVLLLPTGTAIGKMQIYKICNLLKHLVNNSFEIKERLTQKNVGKVLVS